jgi:hypothetical protein
MFFSPETKLGSEIMQKILNLASFEAKKFSPALRFEAKITKSKRSEKFKVKKSEKNRLEICFALFRFEVKITKVKRSEKFEMKISKKKRKNISGIIVNQRNTCETDPISLYFAYKRKNFLSGTGAP